MRKLSNITIVQSSKPSNTSLTIFCSKPDAGPTPSGKKRGRTNPQGVWTLNKSENSSLRGI